MADLGGMFDSSKVEPNQGRDPVPAGDYRACIVASEINPNSKKTGRFVEFTFQILDGQFQNRKLWTRLNLWNPSQEAVKIAQGDLSAIGRAVGVLQITDTSQLHNKPLTIGVKVVKDDKGNNKNEISSYKPAQVAAPAAFAQSEPQRQFVGQQAPWGGPA